MGSSGQKGIVRLSLASHWKRIPPAAASSEWWPRRYPVTAASQ